MWLETFSKSSSIYHIIGCNNGGGGGNFLENPTWFTASCDCRRAQYPTQFTISFDYRADFWIATLVDILKVSSLLNLQYQMRIDLTFAKFTISCDYRADFCEILPSPTSRHQQPHVHAHKHAYTYIHTHTHTIFWRVCLLFNLQPIHTHTHTHIHTHTLTYTIFWRVCLWFNLQPIASGVWFDLVLHSRSN